MWKTGSLGKLQFSIRAAVPGGCEEGFEPSAGAVCLIGEGRGGGGGGGATYRLGMGREGKMKAENMHKCTKKQTIMRRSWMIVLGLAAVGLMGFGAVEDKATVALIDREEATIGGIWAQLAEASGGLVVEEETLRVRLAAELQRKGLTVGTAEIAGERRLLTEAVVASASDSSSGLTGDRADLNNLDPAEWDVDRATRAVQAFCRQRGLGPVRFEGLLWRSAALRMLSRESVAAADEGEIRRLYEVRFGPRARVLLMSGATAGDVGTARREALDAAYAMRRAVEENVPEGGGERVKTKPTGAMLRLAFAETAMRRSTDASAPVGGVVEPFSLEDSAYPLALREAVRKANEGELTEVFSLGQGGAGIALVLSKGEAVKDAPTFEQERGKLEREDRRRRERLAMDELANRLLAMEGVSVMDRSLAWSVEALRSSR